MKIDIPYLYFLAFDQKGKKIPRGGYFSGRTPVTVDIPETDSLSAPVALTVTTRTYLENPSHLSIDLRWAKGKLWKRLTDDSGKGDLPGNPLSMDAFLGKIRRSVHDDGLSRSGSMLHCLHPGPKLDAKVETARGVRDGSPYVRINDSYARSAPFVTCDDPSVGMARKIADNNRLVRNYVKSHAKRYLLIDGLPWTTASEPLWACFRGGLGGNHGSTYLALVWDYHMNLPWHCHYRADETEKARIEGGRMAVTRGDTNSVEMVDGIPMLPVEDRMVVHIPEALCRNPRVDHGDGDPLINSLMGITDALGAKDPVLSGLAVLSRGFSEIGKHVATV